MFLCMRDNRIGNLHGHVHYLDLGSSYIGIYTSQNSSQCTKISICKLCLSKVDGFKVFSGFPVHLKFKLLLLAPKAHHGLVLAHPTSNPAPVFPNSFLFWQINHTVLFLHHIIYQTFCHWGPLRRTFTIRILVMIDFSLIISYYLRYSGRLSCLLA